MDFDHFVISAFGIAVTVIGWLLNNKDEQQERKIRALEQSHSKEVKKLEESINLLFLKHDQDVQALQDLRVQIAGRHYKRAELDTRFDKLETAFRSGFQELGVKMDALATALMSCHNRATDKKL